MDGHATGLRVCLSDSYTLKLRSRFRARPSPLLCHSVVRVAGLAFRLDARHVWDEGLDIQRAGNRKLPSLDDFISVEGASATRKDAAELSGIS